MKDLMIKLTILMIFIVLSINLYCQSTDMPVLPIDSLTGKITYTDIVYLDSTITKDELFMVGREWMAKSFKSATDVLKMDDKEEGVMVGKGTMPFNSKTMGIEAPMMDLHFTISVYLKNGKYKYEITDFVLEENMLGMEFFMESFYFRELIEPMKRPSKKKSIYFLNQLNENMNILINSLKINMASAKSPNKSDW